MELEGALNNHSWSLTNAGVLILQCLMCQTW